MSTEKTEQNRLADAKHGKKPADAGMPEKRQPDIAEINVSALCIDDSFDGDSDPYNSTGQHMAAKIRDRYSKD